MTVQKKILFISSILLLLLFSLFTQTNESKAFDLPLSFENIQIINNLADPDGFAFSPDGRIFISERITGRLLVAKYNAVSETWAVNEEPFYTFDIPKDSEGDPQALRSAGLRDIAFDPDFDENGLIYAFYMKDDILHNRVVRIKASTIDPDVADLTFGTGGEELLLEIPFNNTSSSGSHNGGAIEFGGDDKLYITTGDGWEGTYAGDSVQSLSTFTGKVFRINADGTIPTDNPFYGTATGDYRAIYALGLRNPYSMSRHPNTDVLYINEARGTKKDRIYIVEAGANYQHEGSGIGTNKNPWAYAADAGGELITGGAWYPSSGGAFPSIYWGSYFVALWGGNSTNTGRINYVHANTDPSVSTFETNVGILGSNSIPVKPVITRIGPDGNLYYMLTTYTTNSGTIQMVRYTAQQTVSTPILSPAGGNFPNPIDVTITTATTGATIYFTTDNSEPTETSSMYTDTITLSENTVLRAKAFKSGFNPSSIAAEAYTFGDQPENIPPVADAGEDLVVLLGQTVTLDGSGSYDPDGDDDFLTDEQWTQLSGPPVEIADATEEIAFFTPLETGVYAFELELSDGFDVATDTVSFTAIRPQRITDGAVVYYPFTESEGLVVHDMSENGAPMDLQIDPDSSVSWLSGGGLAIEGNSLISADDTKIHSACTSNNAITIEAWITPANITQDGPARIVSFSASIYLRNFTLGQQGDLYDVRLRTTETDTNGTPSLNVPEATAKTALTHLVYTRGTDGTATIYINGTPITEGTVDGTLTNWDDSYDFILANEASEDRPWLGEYHLVSVFCRALAQSEVVQNYYAGARPLSENVYLPIIIR